MAKRLVLTAAELILVIAPMTLTPGTLNVYTMPMGVWYAYDETGTVEFKGDWEYDDGPSKIHHYIRADGARLFLFIIETAPQERILVRANSEDEARLRFNGWAEGRREIRNDALSVREVFE